MIIKLRSTGAEVSLANDVAFAFVQAGLADEVILPKKTIPPKTSWGIVQQPISGEVGIAVSCNRCGAKTFFAPPYLGGIITNFTTTFAHCVAPPESIPEEIIRAYKSRFMPNPELAADRAVTERYQREAQSSSNKWNDRDLLVATGGLYIPRKDNGNG